MPFKLAKNVKKEGFNIRKIQNAINEHRKGLNLGENPFGEI